MMKFLICCLFLSCYIFFPHAQAQVYDDSVTIAANKNLNQSWLHRVIFGKHYRPLWSTPVKMKILELERNGYTITREGGSRETFNLRLTDSTGRQYVARSVKKDLTKALPEHLQKSMVGRIFSDLMSANHPYGPLMVPPLANAAGVLHSNPRLCALQLDSGIVKDFESDSVAMIVLLEERPDESWSEFPVFNYATNVVSTEHYINQRLNDNDHETDAELFLRTRLLDLLIGDWSRHEDQYRWALKDTNGIKYLQPVPRDRDHAFYKFNDGLLNKLSLLFIPKTVTFDRKIKNVKHLHIVGEMLGKMILPSISKQRWHEIVKKFTDSITDSVIATAVSRLPPEIYSQNGEKFVKYLKSRRDQMPAVGDKLYNLIFKHPNVIGSNKAELFRINRISKNETLVQVFATDDDTTGRLLFNRIFYAGETCDIHLFALEGNDRIEFHGGNNEIRLKVFPGPGSDSIHIENDNRHRIRIDDTSDFIYTQSVLKQQLK